MNVAFDLDRARSFVARQDIPPLLGAAAPPDIDFDAVRRQALLVGSNVVSFDAGVEAEFRAAIADSALLAQLVASRNADSGNPIAWFDSYFSTLGSLGWVTQLRDIADYRLKVDGMEVHEAILDVVSAFLGPVPGALALVRLSLDSLRKMDEGSPLITLFSRESQHATAGRFQFTTVRDEGDGGLFAEAMAFALYARKDITRILFFRLGSTSATMQRSLGRVSLNRAALGALRPLLRRKVETYLAQQVASLDLGDAAAGADSTVGPQP